MRVLYARQAGENTLPQCETVCRPHGHVLAPARRSKWPSRCGTQDQWRTTGDAVWLWHTGSLTVSRPHFCSEHRATARAPVVRAPYGMAVMQAVVTVLAGIIKAGGRKRALQAGHASEIKQRKGSPALRGARRGSHQVTPVEGSAPAQRCQPLTADALHHSCPRGAPHRSTGTTLCWCLLAQWSACPINRRFARGLDKPHAGPLAGAASPHAGHRSHVTAVKYACSSVTCSRATSR
jgi:hypothetical protein